MVSPQEFLPKSNDWNRWRVASPIADVALTVSGTDATIVFSPGDQIVGHTNTVTMEVVSVTDATNMIVKNVSAQIDHAEQLMFRNPIKLMIGLEY